MLNRKLGFVAAAMFLLTLPVVALASTTRLEGMSLAGDYTNDYTAIYGWPSAITGVGNLVYGELGNDLSPAGYPVKHWQNYERAMGAVLPNLWEGRYGVWALHLREQTPALGQGDNLSGVNAGSAFDPNTNTNQAFDLMWGKKFGTNSIGLQLNRSFNEWKDEIPGTTYLSSMDTPPYSMPPSLARNIMGFGAGLGMELNQKTTADFSLLWQSRTYENSVTGGTKNEDNGGSNYMFAVRAMHKCMPNVTVVPVFKIYSFDLSTKSTTGGTSTTVNNTLKGWQVGAAGNWTIGSNDLFVLGATVAQNTLDQEGDVFGLVSTVNGYAPYDFNDKLKATESITPQLFMALETQVNPWLALRFGATKGAFRTVKVEGTIAGGNQGQTLTLKDSPFAMNMGTSVKVGNLTFDALLDNFFYLNPVAQLMGSNNAYFNNYEVFPKVSATYRW